MIVAAAGARESMAAFRILVNGHAAIVLQRGLDLGHRFGWSELIERSVVQHQGACQVGGEIQTLLNADSVIRDSRVGLVARGGHVGDQSTPAVADYSDGSGTGRVL